MIKIRDIMTKNVLTLTSSKPLTEVIKVMADSRISCIVAVDEQNKVVGLVTERDMIKKVLREGKDPKKLKFSDIMTEGVITASPDGFLHDISEIMRERVIRHVPIVEHDKLVGLITQSDIVRETHNLSKKTTQFNKYQNVQTLVIILFFIFLIGFVIFKRFIG